MRVEAVCFDFGGTLDGPADHWLPRFARLYAQAGMQVRFDDLRAAFAHATRSGYCERRVASMSLDELARFHLQCQFDHLGIRNPALLDEMADTFVAAARSALAESREVLRRLHRRFSLGVISNFYGNVDRVLEEAGIAPLLATIIDSNRVGVSKPDPAIFQLAVDALGCLAGNVLYVGDSFEKDIVGARRAGMQSAWLVGSEDPACAAPELVGVRLRALGDLEIVLA